MFFVLLQHRHQVFVCTSYEEVQLFLPISSVFWKVINRQMVMIGACVFFLCFLSQFEACFPSYFIQCKGY